jgi:stage III sporulation protein AB
MWLIIKIILLLVILGISTMLGFLISKKYSNRVSQLRDLITALEIFETRINYTYDSIPDCFKFIGTHLDSEVYRIFLKTCETLGKNKNITAGNCFSEVIDEEKMFLALNNNDVDIIKGLSVSLGQMDLENQSKNIRLIMHCLNGQLDYAIIDKNKNFKLYRNMGILTRISYYDYIDLRLGGIYGDTITF